MWLMLQQDDPEDFVIATGEARSVREFVEAAFQEIGVEIEWKGKGVDEKGVVAGVGRAGVGGQGSEVGGLQPGDVVVEVDPRYFRPTEVDFLLGDATKAREKLGWSPRISFDEMVSEMVREDLEQASKDQLCRESGFQVLGNSFE
jgi:GDPmannose 4,6-dehydratase